MASDRPIFLRPVEIVAPLNAAPDNFHFEITVDNGANWEEITIPSGVYASVLTLCYAIEKEIQDAYGVGNEVQVRPYVDTALHTFSIFFAKTGANIKINWKPAAVSETALRNMLGFNSDLCPPMGPGGATLHASYNFGNTWFPYRNPSDREGFQSDQKAAFKGVKVAQGQLVGIGVPTVFTDRDFEFPMEPATNVLEQFCTNAYYVARCAETFFKECRTAQVNISTHKNPRGFWFVKDVEYLAHNGPISGQAQYMKTTADNGIHFHYTINPNRWVYGNPPVGGPNFFKVAVTRGQAYYDVNFNMETAETPTFTVSDALA